MNAFLIALKHSLGMSKIKCN